MNKFPGISDKYYSEEWSGKYKSWGPTARYYHDKHMEYGGWRYTRVNQQIGVVGQAIIDGMNDHIRNGRVNIHWDSGENVASFFSTEQRDNSGQPTFLRLVIRLLEVY